MKANPEKFQCIVSNRHQDITINFDINGMQISSQKSVILLGIEIDTNLKFDSHIDNLCKKAGKQLNVLKRFSTVLNSTRKYNIYQSFVLSVFDYAPVVWMFSHKNKLIMMEKLNKRALQYVYDDQHSTYKELLERRNSETFQCIRNKCLAIEVFKSINKLSPKYMHDIFKSKDINYSLRDTNCVIQPKVNTVNYGIQSFYYHGAKIWNNLPVYLKNISDFDKFKSEIRNFKGPLCKCSFCCTDVLI